MTAGEMFHMVEDMDICSMIPLKWRSDILKTKKNTGAQMSVSIRYVCYGIIDGRDDTI